MRIKKTIENIKKISKTINSSIQTNIQVTSDNDQNSCIILNETKDPVKELKRILLKTNETYNNTNYFKIQKSLNPLNRKSLKIKIETPTPMPKKITTIHFDNAIKKLETENDLNFQSKDIYFNFQQKTKDYSVVSKNKNYRNIPFLFMK